MQNEAAIILLQFLFVSIATCAVYFIGFFLLPYLPVGKWENKSSYARPYFTMVLGLVIVVLAYSLIVAKGKTIHFLLLPILIGLLFLPRENSTQLLSIQNLWRPLLWFVIGGIFFVVLFHLLPESEYKQKDAMHYSHLSQSLGIFGNENAFTASSLLEKPHAGVEPYHYFEFWWNAILLRIFGDFLPGVIVLRFVCFATLSSIALFGFFSLAEKLAGKPLTFWQKFFCVAFVFYWPNVFALFGFLRPVFTYSFENNLIERPNLRTLYLFIPGLLMALKSEYNIRQILFWIIAIMVASVAFFAVVSPAIILLCLVFFFWKGNKNKTYNTPLFVCIMLASVGYLLFYHFFHIDLKATTEGVTANNLFKYVSRYWKIISLTTVTSVFNSLFIPVLFFLFLKKKYGEKWSAFFDQQDLVFFLSAVILCGVAMARFFNFVDNSYQFAFTSYTASGFIFFVMVFGSANKYKLGNIFYFVTGGAVIIFFLLMRFVFPQESYASVFSENGRYSYGGKKFSKKYLNNLVSAFPTNAKVNGAFWADSLYYDTIPYYSNRNPNIYTLPSGYILSNKLKFNYETCLSDSASIMYRFDTTQKVSYDYLKSAIFRSMYYSCKSTKDDNDRRLEIIKKNKLQYLILTKNADTSIINQLPISKYFQDSITGERFYLIDTKKY